MKKFKNLSRPHRKYIFNTVGHKKALKIWWDSPFKGRQIKLPAGCFNEKPSELVYMLHTSSLVNPFWTVSPVSDGLVKRYGWPVRGLNSEDKQNLTSFN